MVRIARVQEAAKATVGTGGGGEEGFMKHPLQTEKEAFIHPFSQPIHTACYTVQGTVLGPRNT